MAPKIARLIGFRDSSRNCGYYCSATIKRHWAAYTLSQCEESAGAVFGAGMEVSAGGSDGSVAQGGLNKVDGGAAVQGMRGVGVAQPMGRDGELDAGAGGSLSHDPQYGEGAERQSVIAGAEDGIHVPGRAAEGSEQFADRFGQLHGAGFAALAEDGDLDAIAARLDITPVKRAEFADADGGSIEQGQQGTVPGVGLQAEHAMDLAFRKDPLGESVTNRRQAERAADIERQISDAVSEGQQGLGGGQGPVAAGRGQFVKRIGKDLEIVKGDREERLPCPGKKTPNIVSVR